MFRDSNREKKEENYSCCEGIREPLKPDARFTTQTSRSEGSFPVASEVFN